MSDPTHQSTRILAVYPMWRGFGFAVMERRVRLIRWGIARLYSRTDAEFLRRFCRLVERYNIARLALEDTEHSRRGPLARRRLRLAARHADTSALCIDRVGHAEVLKHFGQEHHYDVAVMIAEAYPELKPRLPPKRRLWDSEDPRMCLFKTVAIAAVAACLTAS